MINQFFKTNKINMKKAFFILGMVALTVFGFSSCKKCTTCSVTSPAGVVLNTSSEVCGSSSEVSDFETSYKSAYSTFGTVTCN